MIVIKVLRILLRTLIAALPLAALFIPLPLDKAYDTLGVRICICVFLWLSFFFLRIFGSAAKKFAADFVQRVSGGSIRHADGMISLVMILLVIVGAELVLRFIPASYLLPDITNPPSVNEAERGIHAIRTNGFRGRTPCESCPERNLRIFTMGGSSTYGVPMVYPSSAYAGVLQRLFDDRKPWPAVEVLNAGIAGYGIHQILDTIEEELLRHKPDIVTICAWFNDSSRMLNWYGVPGKSDKQAREFVQRVRAVEQLPLYQWLRRTRTFGVFRFYILEARKRLSPPPSKKKRFPVRATAADFEAALEQIAQLSKKHDFLPVLVFEALNHTTSRAEAVEKNRYYQAIERIAKEHDIPIVDTLTPLAAQGQEWLFYDFIHPNERGHELIAEAIYHTLTSAETQTERSRTFLARRGIALR